MEVTKIIEKFRQYITNAWAYVIVFNENDTHCDDLINNWLQANWEILVESTLTKEKQFLEVYGFGADYGESSSRISFQEQQATHAVICKTKDGKLVRDCLTGNDINLTGMDFMGFVTLTENYFNIKPPFNYVLLQGQEGFAVVDMSEIVFDLQTVENA